MPDHGDNNGWGEWKNHVLQSLQRHEDKIDEVLNIVKQIEIENSAQRVKSSLLGTLGGGITAGVMMVVKSIWGKP
jgi:hypothetical protein